MLIKKQPKKKSEKQVSYLLSKVSPLTPQQKMKLAIELHTGKVTVIKGRQSQKKKDHV